MSRNAESHFAVNPTRIDMSRSRFDRSSSYKTTFNVGQIIPFYVDICPKARIQGFPIDSENWFDVGKPETLANAEAYYASL